MGIPLLPESAPFSPAQRSWLNGFFAGLFGFAANSTRPASTASPALTLPPATEEQFPWHDPALSLDERMKLAEGKPFERLLMAPLAQLDCGACGYLCKTYSEAIASGAEKDLTRCSPGGRETAKKLKELMASSRPPLPATSSGHPEANGKAKALAAKPVERPTSITRHDRTNPFPAPLLRCERLTRSGSEKDVRFVSFSLRGSDLSYEVGDAIGVFPRNDAELVEAILERIGARGDELVPVPAGGQVHAYDALIQHYAVTRVTEELATLLADSVTNPSEAGALKAIIENDAEGVLESWDLLDLLVRCPSARAPVADLIAALAPLQPRLYSISSSLKACPDEVHLTVGVVRYSKGGRIRKGVASNFLAGTLRPRQKASVFVHTSPGFRLPPDGATPIIMIGPGTGIAPFRAFLQERAATGARGKNWLFFGDQRRQSDFLYQDEIEGHVRGGLLTRLDLAFSRDQSEKVYVQHRMKEQAREIWSWLQDGAHVYVCGDARRMALDVDQALCGIVAEQGGMSADTAREFVRDLAKSRRYQRDVY